MEELPVFPHASSLKRDSSYILDIFSIPRALAFFVFVFLWLAMQVLKSFGILGLQWFLLTNPVSDHWRFIPDTKPETSISGLVGWGWGVVVVVGGGYTVSDVATRKVDQNEVSAAFCDERFKILNLMIYQNRREDNERKKIILLMRRNKILHQ